MFRCLADHMRTVPIGQKQAAFFRENIQRDFLVGREKQPVTVKAVIRPFLIDFEIFDR